ncbi:hypothetical protein P171DRAFT_389262, partial [Karstenula rhodostoma CBS 690.94]
MSNNNIQDAMADQKTFKALCHCKSSQLSFTVPTSSLPLPAYFCHCSICRRTHGTLCTIHAKIPPPKVDLNTFTAYNSTPTVQKLFCSTCGAHMLDNAHEEDGEAWFVEISMVDADESTWNFESHHFLENTKDGGLSTWLPEIGGKALRMWKRGSPSESEFVQPPKLTANPSTQGGKLKAHCHCGGVEFHISPPRGDELHKDSPDNMTPKDKTKWYALVDACNSCRLISGCAVIGWAFPEKSHITLADGSPYRPLFGTLKAYKSSMDVDRTFCDTCGAVVTYTCGDRPNFVDVAVGLLDAESGVRAEEWLEWRTHRMSYEEDCIWVDFKNSMKMG